MHRFITMKPTKETSMFQGLFLLILSPAQWTQLEWVRLESYLDPTISFMGSLEQETITPKVTILKVNITYTMNQDRFSDILLP